MIFAITLALLWQDGASTPNADAVRPKRLTLHQAGDLFEDAFRIGKTYYLKGHRKEAVHFFNEALALHPSHAGLTRFVRLLQDYDNPLWRGKQWRAASEKTTADFERRASTFRQKVVGRHLQAALKQLAEPSTDSFRSAHALLLGGLELQSGPFELDRSGNVKLGKSGSIPSALSSVILEKDLARINGKLWFRDSLLRSLPSVQEVHEARSELFYVRVLSSQDRARVLLEVMEQAYEQYVHHKGGEVFEPMGLFIFPDKAGFERYCGSAGLDGYKKSSGFARHVERVAVTFEQQGLEQVCVHEGAHLYYQLAFRSTMPSWYEEGFANYFGQDGTFRLQDGQLTTGLPLRRDRLAALLNGGFIPIEDLLHGDAVDYINRGGSEGHHFYSQAWAVYTFLETTDDPRFLQPYETWQGFALGSGYKKMRGEESAEALFDRLFADVKADLERALESWIGKQVETQ